MVERNYRATVEYDGTDYHGFQIQPDHPTIQGELERALAQITQRAVRLHGAGRTDAGVHAKGQVISFRAEWSHDETALQRALNAVVARNIAVRDLAVAPDRFHARYSARSRTYLYCLYTGPVRAPLLDRYLYYVPYELNLGAMQRAVEHLVGEHDFAAFGQATSGDKTVRLVHRAVWRRSTGADEPTARALPERWQFEIQANGFLRGMIRRVVGLLIRVGSGLLTVGEFVEIFLSADISRCGVRAPACGLCLWHVEYPGIANDHQ